MGKRLPRDAQQVHALISCTVDFQAFIQASGLLAAAYLGSNWNLVFHSVASVQTR